MQRHTPRRKTLFASARSALWVAGRRLRPGFVTAALFLTLLSGGSLATPENAQGQTMQQLLQVMRDGGTWLSLPIEDGRGSYLGPAVPTMGMAVAGWFQISDVHRGEWSIKVVDLTGGSETTVVDADARPGERVPVAYDAGATVQVKVDVEWSEPADTVLWVWVGIPTGEPEG